MGTSEQSTWHRKTSGCRMWLCLTSALHFLHKYLFFRLWKFVFVRKHEGCCFQGTLISCITYSNLCVSFIHSPLEFFACYSFFYLLFIFNSFLFIMNHFFVFQFSFSFHVHFSFFFNFVKFIAYDYLIHESFDSIPAYCCYFL